MSLNKIALDLISKYKEKTEYKPHTCKYLPTCSTYARQCYTEYNFFIASLLTFFRILRCNPLTRPRVNPIPKYKKNNVYLYKKNITIRNESNNILVVKYYNKVVNKLYLDEYLLENENYYIIIKELIEEYEKREVHLKVK